MDDETRKKLQQTIDSSIASIIGFNLALLGIDLFEVPLAGRTGGKRARGYLLGLVEGLFDQFSALGPDNEIFVNSLGSAFAATYGEHSWNAACDTIDEYKSNDSDILFGMSLGRADVEEAYSDKPHKIISGFYRLSEIS